MHTNPALHYAEVDLSLAARHPGIPSLSPYSSLCCRASTKVAISLVNKSEQAVIVFRMQATS